MESIDEQQPKAREWLNDPHHCIALMALRGSEETTETGQTATNFEYVLGAPPDMTSEQTICVLEKLIAYIREKNNL